MLEPPDLPNEAIAACLEAEYGLPIAHIAFLPLGADPDTAVYRATAHSGRAYFVKLRSGTFDPISVVVPKLLASQGIAELISPLPATDGGLWAALGGFTAIVYPFIAGQNAYTVALSDQHWRTFGSTLRRLHTAAFSGEVLARIPQEHYNPDARECLAGYLAQLDRLAPPDEIAEELIAFLQAQRGRIHAMVVRATQLAEKLCANAREHVVCHGDLHAGNIYIAQNGEFYLVDWDTLIRAPKERDLMFVGGAQGFTSHSPQHEEALFYAHYGPTTIDRAALAYYRYERVIQDLAIYCNDLLASAAGGADRAAALGYVKHNFLPAGTIERAYAAEA